MCGFAGFLGARFGGDDSVHELLNRMGEKIAHRGPDDEGIVWLRDVPLGLVHRRLSIIDLSKHGHQPMWSACRRYLIVYNGEVYNYRSIRRELEGIGSRFVGNSDTEVVINAISILGLEAALEQFVGMFAFVLWDTELREMTLVRDRLGIKPLYYAYVGGSFLFASELNPLREIPIWKDEVDRNALADFLNIGYVPAPASIYANAYKLPPGHLLKVRFDGEKAQPANAVPYWTLRSIIEQRDQQFITCEEEALSGLREHLTEAVRIRMISDVPIGAFLSGGLDSTLVTAIMQSESSGSVKTFSIGMRNAAYDEARSAANVSKYLGTEHVEKYIENEDLTNLVCDLPYVFDEPFSDSSQLPTLLLSRATRKNVTVVLTGDGGDELFAGYNRHIQAEAINRLRTKLPIALRRKLSRLIRGYSPAAWTRLYNAVSWAIPKRRAVSLPGEKAHVLSRLLLAETQEEIYARALSQYHDAPSIVQGPSEQSSTWWSYPTTPMSITEHFLYRDTVGYLHDDLLTKVDRCTMAVSLEARVPFLDHRLVEFAWRLPLTLKLQDGNSKYLMRKLLESFVPKELWNRPKMGFRVPIGAFLGGPLRDWAEDLLTPSRLRQEGFFHTVAVRRMWEEHTKGRVHSSTALWSVLMFQAWLDARAKEGNSLR